MRRIRMASVGLCFLFVAVCLRSGNGRADSKIVDDGIAIKDVTVVSPERKTPLSGATVVIRNGRIAALGTDLEIGPHARQIDGRGRFLIPGLIDSHVHVGNMGPLDEDAISAHPELLKAYRSQLPRSYLAFGFTTLVDLDLRSPTLDWFNATPIHPQLCHCGRGVHIVGGYGALGPLKDVAAADAANVVYEPDQAKSWPANLDSANYTPAHAVDRVAKIGAICLKTFIEPGFGGAAQWPVPLPGTLQALREEAKKRGLVFVVHANAVESWRAALDAHADVIAHGLWHWPGDRLDTTPPPEAREVIGAAAQAGIGVQPTLQAVYGDESIFDSSLLNDRRIDESLPREVIAYLRSDQGQAAHRAMADEYRQAIANFVKPRSVDPAKAMAVASARALATLKMMREAQVKLLFGTDTPSNEGIGNPPGLNGRMEMNHWVEAGVPLAGVLRAATLDNAAAFGISAEVGTIEVGKRADLLLLHTNPLTNISAYDTIETVFVNGIPISRKSLLPTD